MKDGKHFKSSFKVSGGGDISSQGAY